MLPRIAAAMIAAVLLKAAVYFKCPPGLLQQDLHGVIAFLNVLSALYALIAAFMIFVVWDQFNRVQSAISHEAAALDDLLRLATFLSDRQAVAQVRGDVRDYVTATAGDEQRALAKRQTSRLSNERFSRLCATVRNIVPKCEKDEILYHQMVRCIERTGERRDERLAASATQIPATLWRLVLFVSCVLMAGILLLGLNSFVLSAAVAAAVAGTIAFLLSMISDMDNPFTGAWNVSYGPMMTVLTQADHA